jgi:hypothetical protein
VYESTPRWHTGSSISDANETRLTESIHMHPFTQAHGQCRRSDCMEDVGEAPWSEQQYHVTEDFMSPKLRHQQLPRADRILNK